MRVRAAGVAAAVALVLALPVGAATTAPAPEVAGVFIHLSPAIGFDAGVAALVQAGAPPVAELPAAHVAYVVGDEALLRGLDVHPVVDHLEPAGRAELSLDTAGDATRAREVSRGATPVRDPGGGVVDGSGVGIAVIDSGVDGTHPDLRGTEGDPKVVRNFKVMCSPPFVGTAACREELHLVEVEDSDSTEGHGTGVAGVAAGDGAAGGGRFTGIAPGAKLYGFGAGDALQGLPLANIAIAYQWIHDHGLAQDPPIRVLNNSWAGFGAFDPDSTIAKLTDALVADRGVTVVFAGGNEGGDGSADETNAYGKNPRPGVLQVANYDDGDRGTRDGVLASESSRGYAGDARTWPDLAAPGERITSPCKAVAIFCTGNMATEFPPYYARAHGTSFAAPHVAGVVAMLYQAVPGVTPAEVEDVLEDTAHPFTAGGPYAPDPYNADSASSFDKGHGLLDARAAVEELIRRHSDGG